MADPNIPVDLPRLPARAADSHKGTYGNALLIGGSRGMAGAIALAGMACLRSGAGKVRLAVPDCCLDVIAQFDPCYMTTPLESSEHGALEPAALEKIQEIAMSATCVAIGPGLSCSEPISRLVGWLYRTLPQPLVVDADGLNALAGAPEALAHPGGPRILTPHPGEFGRLCKALGLSPGDSPPQREQVAVKMAAHYKLVVILKGQHSLVTDGHARHRNSTGNPGMAKGGSGDVLTGIVTALICQGLEPLAAARLGAFAHGLAGDFAARALGMVGMTPRDLIDHLPNAWQKLA